MDRPRALLLAAAASLAPLALGALTLPDAAPPPPPPRAFIPPATPVHTPVPPLACDEDSTMTQLMAEVGHVDAFLQARLREPVPDPPSLIPAAENLRTLAEWARDRTEPADERDLPQGLWTDGIDALLAALDHFEATVATRGASPAQMNAAYGRVTQTCADCHAAFRVQP